VYFVMKATILLVAAQGLSKREISQELGVARKSVTASVTLRPEGQHLSRSPIGSRVNYSTPITAPRTQRITASWSLTAAGLAVLACAIAGCGSEVPDTESTISADRNENGDQQILSDAARPNPAATQNVVVIVVDALRPDHLGFYGHFRETAPYLASLASRSVVFTRAVSTSTWTAPSTASLFTGLHPLQHAVQLGIVAHQNRVEFDKETQSVKLELNRIPDSVETLPEIFRNLGYRTFGIATNPNIGSGIGFDRGFDRFKLLESRRRKAEFGKAGRSKNRFRWGNGAELYQELGHWKDDITAGPKPFFL
jgi:hypothetical protein